MKKVSIFVSILTVIVLAVLLVAPHYFDEEITTILLNVSLGSVLIVHILLLLGYLLAEAIERDMGYIDLQLNFTEDEDVKEIAFDEGMYVEPEQPQDGRRHKASRKQS